MQHVLPFRREVKSNGSRCEVRTLPRTEITPHVAIDVLADERHAPVAEEDVDSAAVKTRGRPNAIYDTAAIRT
jgi:hypothetical protein